MYYLIQSQFYYNCMAQYIIMICDFDVLVVYWYVLKLTLCRSITPSSVKKSNCEVK